jgi:hypothetical protein
MGGATGGILKIFDYWGGVVIYLLVGNRAWNKTSTATLWRLVIVSSIGLFAETTRESPNDA